VPGGRGGPAVGPDFGYGKRRYRRTAYSQPAMILAKFHRCQGSGKSPSEKCGRPPGSSSIAAIIAVRIRSQWILTFGPITCGCPIWKSASFARPAATAAPMSGRCLSSRTWGQAAQILSRLVSASFRNKYWRAGVLGRTLWSSPPRPWPLSVMRTPVALPPSSNGMEQRYGASFLQSNISFRSEPVRTSRTATQGSSRHAAWGSA
jgi:hypothetical protein